MGSSIELAVGVVSIGLLIGGGKGGWKTEGADEGNVEG